MLRAKYLISEIRFEGIYRKEELEYPEEALKEAIINAVIHRDYIGAHTQLKIYPDKLILWNEGTLPNGIKIADLKKSHPSRPRNELLADVFFKAGLIETWGEALSRLQMNVKKPDCLSRSLKRSLVAFQFVFIKIFILEEKLRKIGLNERQIKAIKYVKERGKITNREYQELNKCSRNTVTNDLRKLIQKGIIKESGKKGQVHSMLLHNNCTYCTLIALLLHIFV